MIREILEIIIMKICTLLPLNILLFINIFIVLSIYFIVLILIRLLYDRKQVPFLEEIKEDLEYLLKHPEKKEKIKNKIFDKSYKLKMLFRRAKVVDVQVNYCRTTHYGDKTGAIGSPLDTFDGSSDIAEHFLYQIKEAKNYYEIPLFEWVIFRPPIHVDRIIEKLIKIINSIHILSKMN